MNADPQTDAEMFGGPDCTCIPWTRKYGTPRYCRPNETVADISGWEPGADCPHHAPQQPAAARVVSAAPDQANLRQRIAQAIDRVTGGTCPGDILDAVLSVLPPPADRAAVLREAADRLDATPPPTDHPDRFLSGVRWATSALRRIARETQQPAVSGPGAADDKQDEAHRG